ncbi:hypothetical protein B0H14DRAFT_2605923 [Mycena olivaceomarginata]|nr:hypothetical protein B0H14DRAFT_2605923 [Mycena olivaceomarginata]
MRTSARFGKLAAKMKQVDESHEMKIMKRALCNYYNRDRARPQVRYNVREGDPGRPAFMPYVDLYDYAVLDGRRISPTSRNRRNSAGSSLIQVRFACSAYVGEVRAVLAHEQPGIQNSGQIPLIMVAWMKESPDSPLDGGNEGFVWNEFPELDVNTWLYDQFEDPEEDGSRPEIIPLEAVQCQIARGTLEHTEPKMWITTTMDRYPTSHFVNGLED